MKRGKVGKWPANCPTCGCPCVITKTKDCERTVWAYEALDRLQEEVRILNAIIDDRLPRAERNAARARYNPQRGIIEQWCEDTKWEGEGI